MPRGQYERTKSLAGHKKRRNRYDPGVRSKKKMIIIELDPTPKPTLLIKQNEVNHIDDYYKSLFEQQMKEIQSAINFDSEAKIYTLSVIHGGFILSLQSNDEDTITHTRQAVIGLIVEMDKKNISMEFYEECTTLEGQKKYGLFL